MEGQYANKNKQISICPRQASTLTLALEPELKHPAAGPVLGVHLVVTFLLEVSFVAALAL